MISCPECFCPPGDSSSPAGQRTLLGVASIRRWLQAQPRLRTEDRLNEDVALSRVQMDGDDKTPPGHQVEEERGGERRRNPAPCGSDTSDERLHTSVHATENCPTMRAVLRAQVWKLYRFVTEDQGRLLVREHMWESPLSFSIPKQLLSALVHEHTLRVQEVEELGDLSPHWDGLRHDVVGHCRCLIGCYQETLARLHALSASTCFKSSGRRAELHLQFVPTNLHAQRMEVTAPSSPGVWYDVITFGAPAHHHQTFKHGGLKKLLSEHTENRDNSFSGDERRRAGALLDAVARLQPLVFGFAEELLAGSLEPNATRLQRALGGLRGQTEQFVHALKDDLVKTALLAIRRQVAAHRSSSHVHSNGLLCEGSANQEAQQVDARCGEAYDEEEWDRAWANVAMSLTCIVAMVERLRRREQRPLSSASSSPPSSAGSWQEQLLPLVVTLRDCVREAAEKARAAMTFVVLQGAAGPTVNQGPAQVVQRRHAVFSQALSALVLGFTLKLNGALERPDVLQQLHAVGILAQFESLLSTYGDELGMLEDMEVGVSDLSQVAFTVTEADTEQPDLLLPTLSGTWGSFVVEVPLTPQLFRRLPEELKDRGMIRVHPVLFNIGINQQQSLAERFGDSSLQDAVNQQNAERLRLYCDALRERLPHMDGVERLSDLLSSLDRSLDSRRRKNVEVLWIAAAVCRTLNGVRLTSCKSAKDRTAMSVTLEQCVLLRERHTLGQQHFTAALDAMRRDGCRTENVLKNVGNRKFAFSSVQLLTFPKLYRPPDGSYGSAP